jgi:hypothetical protein
MSTDEKKIELMLLEDAAAELATTGLRLLMLIREGKLAGIETDGEWRISRESLERLKSIGIAQPEPKGCGAACSASNCDRH